MTPWIIKWVQKTLDTEAQQAGSTARSEGLPVITSGSGMADTDSGTDKRNEDPQGNPAGGSDDVPLGDSIGDSAVPVIGVSVAPIPTSKLRSELTSLLKSVRF